MGGRIEEGEVKAKDDEARRPGSDKSQSQSQKETSEDVEEVDGCVCWLYGDLSQPPEPPKPRWSAPIPDPNGGLQ